MISILKSTSSGLKPQTEFTSGCWINVVDPTTDEIESLSRLGIPQDFVTYPLDVDERSRTEREDDGTVLIVLRVPYFQGVRADIPYITIPLGIVINDDYIVTICRWKNDVIQKFLSGQVRALSTYKHNQFVLKILLHTASKYLTDLREINRTTDILEDQLQLSMNNNQLLEILKYQKSMVYFTTALKTNELMLERLQRSQLFRMYAEDEDLLEDVITENQQAIEMTNIYNTILSSMMDAFASIISNNMNMVMKFLASVTIVLSLPTIVTSFFGMNVPVPFENNSIGYLIILAATVIISLIVVAIFYKRDWF